MGRTSVIRGAMLLAGCAVLLASCWSGTQGASYRLMGEAASLCLIVGFPVALAIACDIHPVQNLKVLARLRQLGVAEDRVDDARGEVARGVDGVSGRAAESQAEAVTDGTATAYTATDTTAAPATSGPLRRFWGAESSR